MHGGTVAKALKEPGTADEHAERTDMALHVAQAVDSLSSKQKMVFTLKYYDGYKIREIAEMLELADGTVKRYLFAATRKIRKELKDLL